MKEKIIRNYLYSLVYQVLTVLVPLVTTPYISRILTSSEIGLYDYSLTLCTYFTFVASAGIPILAQKEIVLHEEDLSECFSYYFLLRFTLTSVVCCIYCVFACFFDNRFIFLGQGIGLLATGFDISWYYSGKENFKAITNRNVFFKIVSLIFLFAFVKGKNALLLYTLSIAIPNLIGNILLFWKLDVKIIRPTITCFDVVRTLKTSLVLLIPSLVLQLYAIVDKTILGTFSTLSELGYYAQAFKLVNVLTLASTTLGAVIFPQMVRTYNENIKEMCRLTSKSLDVIIHLFFLPVFGIAACADIFAEWFYGSNYIGIENLLVLTMPIVIFKALNYVTANQALIASNREKSLILIICSGTILNCILDVLLVRTYGARGAIGATAISEFFILLVSMRLIKRKEGNIRLINTDNIRATIAAVIEYGGIVATKRFLINRIDNALVATFLMGCFGFVLYTVSLKILKDNYYLEAKKMLMNYIRRREK